jgi:hypothetical protein
MMQWRGESASDRAMGRRLLRAIAIGWECSGIWGRRVLARCVFARVVRRRGPVRAQPTSLLRAALQRCPLALPANRSRGCSIK